MAKAPDTLPMGPRKRRYFFKELHVHSFTNMLFVIFHMTQANEQCSLYNTQVVGYNSYVLHSYTDTGGPAYI